MQDAKNHIVVNEDGAFIPRRIFGQRGRILDELDQAGVFVESQSEQNSNHGGPKLVPVEMIDASREMSWLREHGHEYTGQWVALDGDRLVSHGTNAREVYQAAKQAGVEVPFLHHIDPPDELPFGGW